MDRETRNKEAKEWLWAVMMLLAFVGVVLVFSLSVGRGGWFF